MELLDKLDDNNPRKERFDDKLEVQEDKAY
jgi:hypothetical protein